MLWILETVLNSKFGVVNLIQKGQVCEKLLQEKRKEKLEAL